MESDKLKKSTKMEILETVEKVKAVAVDTDQEAVETQDASQKKELMSKPQEQAHHKQATIVFNQ